MCGISGFVDFKHRSSRQILEKMNGCLAHRGPDGEGFAFYETDQAQIALGHRRLSIIDLSPSGNQPQYYDDLTVMLNGEIYNYREIKEELSQKGHQFKSTSDTEMIMHAYRQWGIDCLHRFIGFFIIILYDARSRELYIIRDRAGVKPLNYYFKNDLLLFGSEFKSLMAHPLYEKDIDTDAVASFLQYNYVSSPHSVFSSTKKLLPGHWMKLNLDSKELKEVQYWNVYDYYNQPKLDISLPEAIDETEKVLEKAFQYRMVADVPVGVFLSGGYDSTCVTSLLQKNSTEKIRTFTIGSVDNKLDEAPFAKQIAARLGTDHTEYYCTAKEALDIIPDLPLYYDEPFADPSSIPTILVSRMARKKVTVALSADAGDEIFAGYNRYDYISRFGKKIRNIPAPIRKLSVRAMEKISSDSIPFLRNKRNFHSRYDKLKNLLNNPSPFELLKNLTQVFSQKEIGRMFNDPVTPLQTMHTSEELHNATEDPLSYMMAVDYQTYMLDDILQKVDRATMSASLEGREPFLDQHVIQWAARLPSEYKYHKKQKKYILRQIVHKYIPKEMMDRPKMGFAIPVEHWLSQELKPLVLDSLSTAQIRKHGLFNEKEIEKICHDFFHGRKEMYLKIWHLLMFQLWYNRWMVPA